MKNLTILYLLPITLLLSACNSMNIIEESKYNEIPSIESLIDELYYTNPNASYDETEAFVCGKLGIDPSDYARTKAESNAAPGISDLALELIDEIASFDPSSFDTKEEYIAKLQSVVVSKKELLYDSEFDALNVAISVSAEIIQLKFGDPDTKSFKEWCKKQWDDWGRCVAGIVGEAGLGAIAGACLGGIEGCVIGSIPGAIIGGICGGLDGASSSC